MRRRGFSLIELVVAVGIAALLLGLALLNTRSAGSGAQTRAVAEILADELRAARQRALATGTPVAVAVPSQGNTVPHSRSIYLLEGPSPPRLTRVVTFRDYPDAVVFVGSWPVTAGLVPTASKPALASKWEDFDLASWQAPEPDDHLFVFTPDGAATSNGRARFDGAYHLLVTLGVEYTGGSVDGQPSFVPTRVCKPVTVSVSPAGEVAVTEGVRGSNGAISSQETAVTTTPPAAPAPPVTGSGNNDPVIDSIDPFPAPNTATLPPGIDCTVEPEGFLTLRVSARDSDGDPLEVDWTASQGTFSSDQPRPMAWDHRSGTWRATWEWYPPPGVGPAQQFALTCTVIDGRGGSDTRTFGAAGAVETLEVGKIVFCSDRDGNWEIYLMNDDGTDQTNLTMEPGTDERPRFSPDGSKICFVSWRTGTQQVFTMNPDGSDVRQLTTTPGWEATYPHWSPDGTKITYSTGPINPGGGSWDTWIMDADGSNRQPFFADGAWDGPTYWRPDGQSLVQMHWAWHAGWDFDLFLLDRAGNLVANLTDEQNNQNDCFWSPDGTRVSFAWQTPGTGVQDPCHAAFIDDGINPPHLDLANRVVLSTTPGWESAPVWNHDGTQLSFASDRTGNKDIFLVNQDGTGLTQLTTDKGNDDWPHWWKE